MKVECPDCGKQVPTTSHPLFYCEKPRARPTVERIAQPALPAPVVQVNAQGTVQVNETGTVQVHPSTVHLPKNRKWEDTHSEKYRAWRKEYDRKRREK